jgi:hypothetical protein
MISAAALGLGEIARPALPRLLRRQDTLSGRDVAIPRTNSRHHDDAEVMTEVLEVEGRTDSWIGDVVERLNDLTALTNNWDGEGGVPVRPEAGRLALQLLSDLMSPRVFAPSIVPGEGGGLWLEWHTPAQSFEVEVRPGGFGTVYWRDREHDSEWEEAYVDARSRIRPALEGMVP